MPNNTTTTDDIESALDIIESNGGAGEFDALLGQPETVERWLFPRFHGASDDADFYMSRTGYGAFDSDVEMLCAWLEAPRNIVGAILALGEPGTGKTALIEAAVTHLGTPEKPRLLTTHLFTPDDTRESLMRVFVGEGKGDCIKHGHDDAKECKNGCTFGPFTLAPLPYAVKHGHVFYGDEAMRLDDGVWPSLYALADGRHRLPGGNVDGSDMVIHPNFRMVLSSNPMVRGASMPEPVASRCAGSTITVETDVALLLDLGIDESIAHCWQALKAAGLFTPQVRELRVADYWLSTPDGTTQAASALVPEHCPESEREAVTNMVRQFIGGDLPTNGRLVVK